MFLNPIVMHVNLPYYCFVCDSEKLCLSSAKTELKELHLLRWYSETRPPSYKSTDFHGCIMLAIYVRTIHNPWLYHLIRSVVSMPKEQVTRNSPQSAHSLLYLDASHTCTSVDPLPPHHRTTVTRNKSIIV